MKMRWLWVLAVCSAACAGDRGVVSSSSDPLTTGTTSWFNSVMLPFGTHFATVSTVVATPPNGSCNGPLGKQQIVSAWEGRGDGAGNSGLATGVFLGVRCANSSTTLFETQVTRGLFGGIDPVGWSSSQGAHANYVGLPYLLPVGPAGWVALVSLVGSDTPPNQDVSTATNIAIALSKDGGLSWGDPHLVAATDNFQGGTDPGSVTEGQVSPNTYGTGLAATASSWTDSSNGGVHDLFVAWTAFGGIARSFFREVGWNGSGIWIPTGTGAGKFPAASQLCQPLNEPSLVAGVHPNFGNFVFLLDPTTTSSTPITGTCAQIATVTSPTVTQVWQQSIAFAPFTQFSWAGQEGFVAGNPNPVCHPFTTFNLTAASWPQCVGGDRTSTLPNNVNIARSPLVYDQTDNVVAAAIASVRPSDGTNSTQIQIRGWHFSTCTGTCGGTGLTLPVQLTASQRDDHVPVTTPEDQFEPAFAFDNVSGKAAIYWYDTAESVAPNKNTPTSLHGQVMALSGAIPGGLKLFYPTPSYRLGPGPVYDLGGYNGVAPFAVGTEFGVAFTDGWDTTFAPNGQGGIYTSFVSP